MFKCKHCKLEFDLSDKPKGWAANHSRWCDCNPKHDEYISNIENMPKRRTADSFAKQSASLKESHKRGDYKDVSYVGFSGKRHSDETKEKIRDKAIKSNHRRLVRSVREYIKKDGSTVMLDSSWEEMLAKRLDEQNIEWVRPGPMKWVDSTGRQRNYFPDFYLPESDLFLDPKNPAAMKQQNEKVTWLKQNVKNLVFLCNEEDIETFSP